MSAPMARQGGRVQLEPSIMGLALNMANMAEGGLSRAAMEETQQLIKQHRSNVREEKKRGVEFPGHKSVMAAIEWHLATSAKCEIGFRKWTPRTDRCPHSPQPIRATDLQSSTMLQSVQWCDRVLATSQNVFSHLSYFIALVSFTLVI